MVLVGRKLVVVLLEVLLCRQVAILRQSRLVLGPCIMFEICKFLQRDCGGRRTRHRVSGDVPNRGCGILLYARTARGHYGHGQVGLEKP